MQEDFDLYTLKFINPGDIIEEIGDGYSGALLYKITRGNNKFFLKIFKGNLCMDTINKIKQICLIYINIGIKSLDIIDFGEVENFDKYYIVYNCIEGINLKQYTSSSKYSLEDVREFGKKIGQQFLRLKNYESYDKKVFTNTNIDNLISTTIQNFDLMLHQNEYRNVMLKYFDLNELEKIKNKLLEYSTIFDSDEQKLIHGDIKRANIMIDSIGNLYITDIEAMQLNYDVLNFTYQISWSLFEGSEKEKEFVSGYFDGIYNNCRPQNFNYKILFTIILNFFIESYQRYKRVNILGLDEYAKKCKELFNRLDKFNLDNDFIV